MADVQVPYGILWALVFGSWIRMRRIDRTLGEFAETSGELGTLIGTRWLVGLTIVLGLIGVGSIAATLWAALG